MEFPSSIVAHSPARRRSGSFHAKKPASPLASRGSGTWAAGVIVRSSGEAAAATRPFRLALGLGLGLELGLELGLGFGFGLGLGYLQALAR